ncbi:unnamed protein product [Rhodiola kirilowii]
MTTWRSTVLQPCLVQCRWRKQLDLVDGEKSRAGGFVYAGDYGGGERVLEGPVTFPILPLKVQ